jgi:hypothetical protein
MGATANCPSVEQMLGITDPSDPCQNASAVSSSGTLTGSPCPSAEQLAGIVDPSDPCQATTGGSTTNTATGITALLQSISQAISPTAPTTNGSSCFSFAFPWIGTSQNGVCVMPVSVPSSVGTLITVGIAAFLLLSLAKKGR